MSSSMPWRTVILGESTGRFTREQIRKAFLELEAEREKAALSEHLAVSPLPPPTSAANRARPTRLKATGDPIRKREVGPGKSKTPSTEQVVAGGDKRASSVRVSDPITDMLNRIRNASLARQRRVDLPVSKLKVEVARLLKENNYIHDYKILEDGSNSVLRLYLKYHRNQPVIRELRTVSRPGSRKYVGVDEIPRVREGEGMALISTDRGVMTDREARAAKLGGELLAIVW